MFFSIRLSCDAYRERLLNDYSSQKATAINDDEVLIDTTQRVLNMQDRIWACAYQGAGMIKRLRAVGEQKVEIRSDNKTVGDQVVPADDLHIVGRVIWIGRRV
jgi:phage repressor protein C with HTH and peptisase S24 domain